VKLDVSGAGRQIGEPLVDAIAPEMAQMFENEIFSVFGHWQNTIESICPSPVRSSATDTGKLSRMLWRSSGAGRDCHSRG
jgi:hypothetical protein